MDGNSARIRSTVSIMFAPGWRKMMTVNRGNAVEVSGGANVLRRV